MNQTPPDPIAQQAYDLLAERYAEQVLTKPHNAYYERPAMLSLLPDVRGKRVLDAGCGPGVYSELLLDRGAEVIAIDANPKMVQLAHQRLQNRAQVLQADLGQPLTFLPSVSFDLVISPLVLDYVRDWEQVFTEFYRLLRHSGVFIFSIEHPQTKFSQHRESANYFAIEQVVTPWHGFGITVNMPSYRRPLSEVFNPLIYAGFRIDYVLEPLPTPEFAENDPKHYAELIREPGFLCIRAVKG
ncbi:MAG: SAM-dependent methyltransferase [Chloroflexus sp.]|uniref:class I SAM-dependent methyltransferase n=1 Tax=Chloroflexus sp. TaxID=1904827 RepID=UPI0021DD6DCA|nr:methyltransferase domain-containing protein [Chloroflexus sp.]GIV88744.1 MAG: SAM-dependent methyltransferase [Chloroflexus sp.]